MPTEGSLCCHSPVPFIGPPWWFGQGAFMEGPFRSQHHRPEKIARFHRLPVPRNLRLLVLSGYLPSRALPPTLAIRPSGDATHSMTIAGPRCCGVVPSSRMIDSATARNAPAASLFGALTTIGVPASDVSRMAGSKGISPRNGTPAR